jgi:hypothetical protein
MVQIQNYLQKTNYSKGNNSLPLLNSLFTDQMSQFSPYTEDNTFKNFMRWARKSPQLLGFGNLIATDMLSDEVEFTPVEEGTSGRNKVIKARKFWNKNQGEDVTEESIYDFLFNGIGFNWIGKISEKEGKELCSEALKNVMPEMKEHELEFKASELYLNLSNTNKDQFVKKLRHVAASTMKINPDEHGVVGYTQRVGVNIRTFTPDEIIAFKMMPLDGKVYPFPPMEALMSEIYLLWLITQNYVSFFENGGKPDNVFILPKEIAGSKNHEYLIETLKKYKKIQNKHGNLVFTGDLQVEKLMDVEHQMENKDLGLYLVSVLAMFYGIPVGRLPFLVGKAAAGGDSGGLADSGYWRKISVWQSKFEAGYNRALWEPYFGVRMKFRRGYLQDEVRETQNEMQRVQIAEQKLSLGLMTVEGAGRYLKIDEEEVAKAQAQKKKREDEEIMKSGMLNQNLNNNDDVIKERDAKNKAKTKQKTQNENQKNAGGKKINP